MTENERPDWLQKAIDAISASTPESDIYIGCDSVRYKQGKKRRGEKPIWFARYSVVIVLHNNIDMMSKGCSLFHHTFTERDYGDIRTRMMREAQEAIEIGLQIREEMPERKVQIHLDINPDEMHKSSIAVSQALGWAKGMGFDARVKPEAWAATHAADHVARR